MNKEPAYARNFHCLADTCPDSCCKEWEIIIDPETVEKYRNLHDKTGQELQNWMLQDEDGDAVFRAIDSHCPWWNKDGLCELRIRKGQAMTSLICRLHPLIIEEYESFTEQMLSLSCPAAYQLITSSPIKGTYSFLTEQAEDEVLNLLCQYRNAWLKEIDETSSVAANLQLLYTLAVRSQAAINAAEAIAVPVLSYPDLPHGTDLCNAVFPLLKENMEVTTERFRRLLHSVNSSFQPEDFPVLSNRILAYFACRYELKAVNNCDLITHIQFIELSLELPALLASVTQTDIGEAYRLYSREVEHNTENRVLIYDLLQRLSI